MLKKRVVTALWGIPLLGAAIWFDQPLPWFTILVALWGGAAVFEFYRMSGTAKLTPLAGFGIAWGVLFIISPHFDYESAVPLMLASGVFISLLIMLLGPAQERSFHRWAWTMAGMLYVGWLLSHLVAMWRLTDGGEWVGRDWVFLTLFAVFASDTAAFFAGRAWGKRRLAPNISPGKTWEGAIAGLIGAIGASLILVTILDIPVNYGQAVLVGCLISVFGQLGDLVESLFKRNTGVKDSGRLMPGHGGLLDRLDSIIFAGVVVYYYVSYGVLN